MSFVPIWGGADIVEGRTGSQSYAWLQLSKGNGHLTFQSVSGQVGGTWRWRSQKHKPQRLRAYS